MFSTLHLIVDLVLCVSYVFLHVPRLSPRMLVTFLLLILLAVLYPPALPQHSFSDSSHRNDLPYVKQQIHETSDTDLWASLDIDRPCLKSARRSVRAGNVR